MLADLALVGFGHVGRRFAELVDEQRDRLAADFDLTLRICGIATRRHGSAWDGDGLDTAAAGRAIEAGEALRSAAGSLDVIARLARSEAPLRIVVETTTLDIAAGQPAIDHVRAAIGGRCHVVTANKGPVAFAYAELHDRAEAAGVSFLFEGAVMDGIPIFNLVRETLPAVGIIGFRGVVNATTNHILTALEEGESFGPALARMQAAGIAEADASLDVDGWDAAAKTAALANVLMDARVTPHDIDRTGIDEHTGARAREAVAQGTRLRLVASASRAADGRVSGVVRPTVLPGGDLLAGLTGQANALVLQTDLLGEIAIAQLGGSLTQTAYALVSDIVTIRRRQRGPGAAPVRRTL